MGGGASADAREVRPRREVEASLRRPAVLEAACARWRFAVARDRLRLGVRRFHEGKVKPAAAVEHDAGADEIQGPAGRHQHRHRQTEDARDFLEHVRAPILTYFASPGVPLVTGGMMRNQSWC